MATKRCHDIKDYGVSENLLTRSSSPSFSQFPHRLVWHRFASPRLPSPLCCIGLCVLSCIVRTDTTAAQDDLTTEAKRKRKEKEK